MPPKTKRQRQVESILEKARESKRSRLTDEEPSTSGEGSRRANDMAMASGNDDLAQLVTMSEDALDTDDKAVDPSFDLDSNMKTDADHLQESFCEDWISHLKRETAYHLLCSCVFSF